MQGLSAADGDVILVLGLSQKPF